MFGFTIKHEIFFAKNVLLSDIVGKILAKFPADPTDKEDILHAELVMGRTNQALVAANELDPWLSAHLADIMDPLGLLDSIPNEE